MRLSDFFVDEQIVRDATFEALGLSNSQPDGPFLSFIDTDKFFPEVVNNDMVSSVICTNEFVESLLSYERLGIVVSDDPRKDHFFT